MISMEVLMSYTDTLVKLARGVYDPPSLTNVTKRSPTASGKTSVPDIKMPKVKIDAGDPGKSRTVSTPRPSSVKPTQPSQARDVREAEPPEIM